MLRKISLYSVILLISIVAAFSIFEIYFRFDLEKRLIARSETSALWFQNQRLDHWYVDELFGRVHITHPYGLFKVNETIEIGISYPKVGIQNFSVRTNNVGLLSDKEYTIERDPEVPEYRIAILGESFTGQTTATYQWVDTVEDLLNQSSELRHAVNGKRVKVYNFGWIGGGFKTFWKEFNTSARYYTPDLVLINYLELDFPRAGKAPVFSTEEAMLENALLNIGKIRELNKNLILTVMPTYGESMSDETSYDITDKLAASDPTLEIEIMRKHLPTHLGAKEITSWYNMPYDAHYSDKGGEKYARAISGVITKKISGIDVDFTNYKSKYSDEMLSEFSLPTRVVDTPLSRMTNNKEYMDNIREYILQETLKGKLYNNYRSYALNAIINPRDDGITPPYYKHLVIKVQKIPFGPNKEKDFVVLPLTCSSEPVTLRNPDCYYHFHLFAKSEEF